MKLLLITFIYNQYINKGSSIDVSSFCRQDRLKRAYSYFISKTVTNNSWWNLLALFLERNNKTSKPSLFFYKKFGVFLRNNMHKNVVNIVYDAESGHVDKFEQFRFI